MNFAPWTVTFHWQGIAWSHYSKHFWSLFPLGHKGSGSDSCSSAAADLSLPGWKLHLLSCWAGAGAGSFGGSQDCCDAARAASCPLAARKGVDSWRTWLLLPHKEQRSSFCIDRNTVSWIGVGILFLTWCRISVSFGRKQRQGICSPKWLNTTVFPGWQPKTWFLLALRRGEKRKESF